MDFRRLQKVLPAHGANSTESVSLTELTPNILDALVPGYAFVSRYAQAAFGFDISWLVSIAILLLALNRGGQFLYNKSSKAFRHLFVSSVYIYEHDDLFDMMMSWVAATHESASRRSVRAKTTRGQKANEDFDATAHDAMSDGVFDYNKWSARTPPRYEPYYGRHVIWHEGTPFLFRRSQKAAFSNALDIRFGKSGDDDLIELNCIGRTVEPIRGLLKTAKMWSLEKQRNTTAIRYPVPKDRARFGGMWSKAFPRPSRPMDTVILDAKQKQMIIEDVNEYLHPSSAKWYATRGIPYRRGYLFYGPPGTGKTSLSFALAGIFGLEIYLISLQEPSMSEGDLVQLFNHLPRRCIVLLEDVDAAGLIRDGKSGSEAQGKEKWRKRGNTYKRKEGGKAQQKNDEEKNSNKDEEYTLKDLARELKAIGGPKGGNEGRQGNPNRQPGAGISLSGLLNAIDGVASHEGRVLIMTTNHPERLDTALIRPGRVDRKIECGLAMKEQIRELFVRMYVVSDEDVQQGLDLSGATTVALNGSANGHADEKLPNGHADSTPTQDQSTLPIDAEMSRAMLEELAIEFASHVPDDTFTPAEVQNHLMRYKKEPRVAVAKVDEWMRETLAEKEKEDDGDEQQDDTDEKEEQEGGG